jgi:hypothetical protein
MTKTNSLTESIKLFEPSQNNFDKSLVLVDLDYGAKFGRDILS